VKAGKTTVPQSREFINLGTLRSIERQAGIRLRGRKS
jgi:predicted RNA binding protein YcfA (HicA-like mRNA interferase family)